MEEQIAAQLQQRIPQTEEPQPAVVTKDLGHPGQADVAVPLELDEMTQYKLHDYFGEQYKPRDEVNRQRISFIYEAVSKMADEPEYGFIVNKIREIERIAGTSRSDNRIYRLYQWLKLDNIRKNTEAEMSALGESDGTLR